MRLSIGYWFLLVFTLAFIGISLVFHWLSTKTITREIAGLPMTPGEPPQRITHNKSHRWLYVPDMRPDEIMVFKQADSRVGAYSALRIRHKIQHFTAVLGSILRSIL